MNNINSTKEGANLLDMVTRFYQGIFWLSPEELADQILTEAATVFQADIATWFLVTDDKMKLQLIDVYNERGEKTHPPDIEPYDLNWNARDESEVKGFTSWVAISGEPHFIPSLQYLLDRHKKSHAGRWDRWLYPDGINDPISGFLCSYSVPLFLPVDAPDLKDRLLGVLKVERRNSRKKVFTDEELMAFDIIANIMGFAYIYSERQKSLTLLDIGHTLIRPLGDVAFSLDITSENLKRKKNSDKDIHRLESSAMKLRVLSQMLSIAKDSFNNPAEIVEVSLREILLPQSNVISLKSGRKIIDQSAEDIRLELRRRSLAALIDITTNLIDNAVLYSDRNSAIELKYAKEGRDVIISIQNQGHPIPEDVLKKAQQAERSGYLFKGLTRSFQLAAKNDWKLIPECDQGKNRFTLLLPSVIGD